MADPYPDDYSNPLPSMAGAGPTQQGLGAGNFVNSPMGQPPMGAGSDATMGLRPSGSGSPALDKRMEYLQRLSDSPMYKIGSAMSGRDPAGAQMMQQQQMIQQQQQFMLNKQVTVGSMLLQYIEKVSSMKQPGAKAAAVEAGREFLGPLLKEIGFNAGPNLFQGLLSQEGTSTQLSNLITSRFGTDVGKINELTSYLSQLDPKDVPATIKGLYDQDVDAALPKWLTHTSQLMSKIKSNPGLLTQLGGMSSDGKRQPLDPSAIMESILGVAKTPADRDAITKIFTDPKLTGFLANQGLMTGSTAEGIQKVTGEALAKEGTPGGMLEMEGKKADLALKAEELKAKPSQLALTQAQTQAALTPSVIPLAGVNTGIAVQGKGPGARPEIVLPPTPQTGDATKMREEFNKLSKEFITVRDFYNQIPTAVKNPSAAGDIGLVFSFMKILDPGSTVREGEFATAANAAGIPDRVRNQINKLYSGERLTVSQRHDFEKQARSMVESRVKTHLDLEGQYKGLAERNSLNPSDVVVDYLGPLRSGKAKGLMPPATLAPNK